MTRRDLRPRQRLGVEERREQILRAAAEAFASAPHTEVSVATVAERCGASPALVHRYFTSREELHLAVVRRAVEDLLERQRAADAELGPRAAPRERVARSVEVYLDFVASAAQGWAAPLRDPRGEPSGVARVRRETRAAYADQLRALLGLEAGGPVDHALAGYLGLVDAAALSWVDAGHPGGERTALVAMAVGALEGALSSLEAPAED